MHRSMVWSYYTHCDQLSRDIIYHLYSLRFVLFKICIIYQHGAMPIVLEDSHCAKKHAELLIHLMFVGIYGSFSVSVKARIIPAMTNFISIRLFLSFVMESI